MFSLFQLYVKLKDSFGSVPGVGLWLRALRATTSRTILVPVLKNLERGVVILVRRRNTLWIRRPKLVPLWSGLQNRPGTWTCSRDKHASACRDKGGAALPRPFACKPRQDARFCKLIFGPFVGSSEN